MSENWNKGLPITLLIVAIALGAFGAITSAINTQHHNYLLNQITLEGRYNDGRMDAYAIACPPGPLVYTPGCMKLFKENIGLLLTHTSEMQDLLKQ